MYKRSPGAKSSFYVIRKLRSYYIKKLQNAAESRLPP